MKKNLLFFFVIAAIFTAITTMPAFGQVSLGGAVLSETEKAPIAMNLVMAVHVVSAPDQAYRPEDAEKLLGYPLAAVASSAMAGPASKPANAPAYFRLTGQGVKNLISLEVSFNGLDYFSCSYLGAEDGFIGVVPRLRPGLYTPVGRLIHRDGRKESTVLFFIRSGNWVEGQVTAAFQLLVTNPIAGIEGMGTREIAGLCQNMIPADGPLQLQQQPAVAATTGEQTAEQVPQSEISPKKLQTEEMALPKDAQKGGVVIIRFEGRKPSTGWPALTLRTPAGVQEFAPGGDGGIVIDGAEAGEYELVGVRGRVSFVTDPINDFNRKSLVAGESIEWTLRQEEER